MSKRILSYLLAVMIFATVLAGCTQPKEVWESYSVYHEGETGGENDTDTERTTRTRKITTGNNQNTQATGKQTRPPRAEEESLNFTAIKDAGANYNVKGTVSIAVDTARKTDYEAMFDVMQKLYPNVTFEFDYWTHSSSDTAVEYLSTRMLTKTAANIIWDEAGEIPTYLSNGWIKPITSYVAKDPEASNIPANLKADYTFFGELYAVPHQATLETIVFNTDILSRIGMKMPGLEWSLEEFEAYLRGAGNSFDDGICVGMDDFTDIEKMVAWYQGLAAGGSYGSCAYNYNTKQFDVRYLKAGGLKLRYWRELPGTEGWFQQQQKTASGTLLQQELGLNSYALCFSSGKALMEKCGSWVVENTISNYDNFNWKMWTTPNKKGRMMIHVDHCFITSSTPADRMDACYQALRFMTFSTNGNLARLTMYDDAEKDKYTLNSHIFYPTTTSKAVLEKFAKLSRTNEVDEYYVKNIKNSCRNDTFKLVYNIRDVYDDWQGAMNDITDGLDSSGDGLDEYVDKANKALKANEAEFKKEYDKRYK